MVKRKIIKINQDKCNGCSLCIPNCPEAAIQIIDGKAHLVNDLFCDGLGACLGRCPEGAITIEEREAREYNERKVMENIVRQGKDVIEAHLEHLAGHGQKEYLEEAMDYLKEKKIKFPFDETKAHPEHGHSFSGCPSAKVIDFRKKQESIQEDKPFPIAESQLGTWPVQMMLVPPSAPYLDNADLLIAADCVPFAYADFHQDLLKDKILLVGCPKLDDTQVYQEKINQILKINNIKSITYVHMEVPCCFGLINIIREAIGQSGKDIPFQEVVISIKGKRLK